MFIGHQLTVSPGGLRRITEDLLAGVPVAAHLFDTFPSMDSIGTTMLRGWSGTQYVNVARVSGEDLLLRDRVRIGPTAPTVATCDELITALAGMGLVVDGR